MALLLHASLAGTGGHLVYALDDAYIHMAVGRNLAEHGVWGVTRYAFTSSTSSLAWPLLLAAADRVGAASEATPVVLAFLFAVTAVFLADRLLRDLAPGPRTVALLAVVLLTPLPTLVMAGMEHTLQLAAVLWLLDRLRAVEEDAAVTRARTLVLLALAAALAAGARYESAFLLAPAVAVLAFARRSRAALAAAAGGVVPVAVYAAVSVAHGWPPVPNSLLLKRATFEGTGIALLADRLGGHAVRTMAEAPHLLVLLVAVLVLAALRPASRVLRWWDAVFVTATLLHVQLAAVGWLFRYEAYLVATGLVLVAIHVAGPGEAPALPARRPARLALALAALVASAPLLTRGVAAAAQTPGACRNIYEQQYQMGLLLRGLPAGSTVMANDIGAVAWLADVRLVDLFGLATRETAEARREGRLDRALLARLAESDPPAAVAIYRSWFADAIPPGWIEVGTWRVPEKVVVADRTVSFYATRPEDAARLAQALAAFQPRLPPSVSARVADAVAP